MNYIIYKITNAANNKIYVGAHQTQTVDDGYMGSSKVLRNAYAKYGMECFTKEVLHLLNSEEEMFNKESEIVNEEFVKRSDTYNVKQGGLGGWSHWNNGSNQHRTQCKDAAKKVKNRHRFTSEGRPFQFDKNEEHRKKALAKSFLPENRAKQKMAFEEINHQVGTKNSQYGTAFYIDPSEQELPDNKNKSQHRYKIGEEPNGWITFIEWRESKKDKTRSAYGKHWYTNGQENFLLEIDDIKIEIN